MRRSRDSEQSIVAELRTLFGSASSHSRGGVLVGIGDDAAVLEAPRAPLVWTIDTAVESVHFERKWLAPERIGARSLHAAVSDLAAMGAKPKAALSNLVVPRSVGRRELSSLVRGQARAARELGCPIVGGNLSRGGELSITTTALGVAKRPLTRAGARAGDEVWLIGAVGLAAAGLRCLKGGVSPNRMRGRARRALTACIDAWRAPRALVAEGLALVGRARSAIDVSDGLGSDAAHVARASGVRIVLERRLLAKALLPELLQAAEVLEMDPLRFALEGGEDYAIIATGPSAKRPRTARVIGRVERGEGVMLEDPDGTRCNAESGFDHFARPHRRRGVTLP